MSTDALVRHVLRTLMGPALDGAVELRPGQLIAAYRGPVNVHELYRTLTALERVALVAFRGSAPFERRVYRVTPAGVNHWLVMGG